MGLLLKPDNVIFGQPLPQPVHLCTSSKILTLLCIAPMTKIWHSWTVPTYLKITSARQPPVYSCRNIRFHNKLQTSSCAPFPPLSVHCQTFLCKVSRSETLENNEIKCKHGLLEHLVILSNRSWANYWWLWFSKLFIDIIYFIISMSIDINIIEVSKC